MHNHSDTSDDANEPGPSGGRRRVSDPSKWVKNVVKKKRDSGEEYVSRFTGQLVAARVMGPPCNDGCFRKVTMPIIQNVFGEFWGIGDYDRQNCYLQKLVTKVDVKRTRKTKTPEAPGKSRTFMLSYSIVYGHSSYTVCRQGFLSIFGISKSRLMTAVKKVTVGNVTVDDQRGRHAAPRKIVGDKARLVREHIQQLPTVSSHYSRAKSPHRKYLESHLTIKRLYDLYLEWIAADNPGVEAVKFHYYYKVFTKEFNIAFQPPRTDTCSTCDKLSASIRASTDSQEEQAQQQLEDELHLHKELSKQGQQLMKNLAKNDEDEVRVICLDMQQTLPIPKLSTSVAYYRRKLWMYNLCIHNLKTEKSTMYVWDEVTGGRGSAEIASCVKHWITDEFSRQAFSKLIIFSDNCGGQNKNINVVLNYLHEVHSKRLKVIEHIYLMPGHSYMACDRAFGIIEKRIARHGDIHSFDAYCTIIKTAISNNYPVVKMEQHNFLDYDNLKKKVVIRKQRNPSVSFKYARMFVLRENYSEGYFIKMSYDHDAPSTAMRLMPGNKEYSTTAFNLSGTQLRPKYNGPLPLKTEKVPDIKALLPYIPPVESTYLHRVLHGQGQHNQEQAAEVMTPLASHHIEMEELDAEIESILDPQESDDQNHLIDYNF